jgi:cytoskeletal protein RodZ
MKKQALFFLSSILLLGTIACQNQNTAKTSADAPNSTQQAPKAVDVNAVKEHQQDAQSQTRRDQLNADIRAHEQRNNAFNGGAQDRTDAALATEVRDKLEANIPESQLVVEAHKGIVTVSGSVVHPQNLKKIDLAMQIKGVTKVINKVAVVPPKGKG